MGLNWSTGEYDTGIDDYSRGSKNKQYKTPKEVEYYEYELDEIETFTYSRKKYKDH
jgi:hypothetical protein